MKSNFQLVQEFHETFQVQQLADPTYTKDDFTRFIKLRNKLLLDEVQEYIYATRGVIVGDSPTKAMCEVIDGLVDIIYIAYGTLDLLGVNADTALAEVHKSNMSKLGEDGEPIINGVNCEENPMVPFGKVMKGPKYQDPNLMPLAQEAVSCMMVPVNEYDK